MQKKPVRKLSDRILLRYELPIILFISILPIILILAISFLWIENNIEDEMSFLASATARRADNILNITRSNLQQVARQTSAHCDQSAVDFIRDKVFKVMYIREIGIINNFRLMCNDVKIFNPPVEITEIEHRSIADQDGELAIVPPVVTLQGHKSILVNYRVNANSYVNALIDPDIFAEFHDYVRLGEVSGVFLVREDGKAVISFGTMSEKVIPPVAEFDKHEHHYNGNIFSIYKSGEFPIYAVVAASPAFVLKHWRHDALFLSGLGCLMSIMLILVLRRNRKHRLNLMSEELWQALEKNEFCVYYHPLLDMNTKQCVGAEALIRWQHPHQGMILPLVFIPIAEQNGMIRYITHWLVRRIDSELRQVLTENPNLHISLNLSSLDIGADNNQINSGDLIFKDIPQQQIIYEITEHRLMPRHVETVHETMATLRQTGAKLAIDDFGTGYSNLSYLQDFHLDYLKIDKMFVDGIQSESLSTGIIDHVIDIARSMKYQLIAEGIEHEYQMNYLMEHGVTFGQGYFFGKPMPLKDFKEYLAVTNSNKEI